MIASATFLSCLGKGLLTLSDSITAEMEGVWELACKAKLGLLFDVTFSALHNYYLFAIHENRFLTLLIGFAFPPTKEGY